MAAKRDFGLSWCFSTLGCPSLDLPGACALARSYGVRLLELRFLENEVDLPRYLEGKYGTFGKVRDLLAQTGLRLASLDTSFRLVGHDEAAREDLLRWVPWAEALGVPRLRIFDGGRKGEAFTTALREEAWATWTWWKELRERNAWRVDLMIETHDALASSSAVGFWAERAGIQCDLLWDSHHTWAVSGDAPEAFWAEHHPRVAHIHLKDSLGLDAGGKPRYTLFGEGRFPYAALLGILQREGYAGPLSIEWERKWHPELPPLEDCLRSLKRSGFL